MDKPKNRRQEKGERDPSKPLFPPTPEQEKQRKELEAEIRAVYTSGGIDAVCKLVAKREANSETRVNIFKVALHLAEAKLEKAQDQIFEYEKPKRARLRREFENRGEEMPPEEWLVYEPYLEAEAFGRLILEDGRTYKEAKIIFADDTGWSNKYIEEHFPKNKKPNWKDKYDEALVFLYDR